MVAVADTSKKRREECASQFGVAKTYAKALQLIADKDIDAVMVALPNFLHAPISLAALESGKHVLLQHAAVAARALHRTRGQPRVCHGLARRRRGVSRNVTRSRKGGRGRRWLGS